MTTPNEAQTQYLPTPPADFWKALLEVRNYLLFNKAEEIFVLPPEQYRGDLGIRASLSMIDRYLDLTTDIWSGGQVVE
jgi:hypothetical protein